MPFDIDFANRGLIKEHIWKFLLYPAHWTAIANQIPHNLTWSVVPFNSGQLDLVPDDKKGIYCFVLKPEFNQLFETRYLFYVGQTTRNFRTRFKEYLDDLSGKGKPRMKVYSMLKLWDNYLHFYYADLTNDLHIDECEEKLLNTFVPKVNTKIPTAKIKPELKYIYE